MILNVGCGDYINEGFDEGAKYVGIDNLSDFTRGGEVVGIDALLAEFKKCVVNNYGEEEAREHLKWFVVADAKHLPFKDKVFGKIFSCRFMGRYEDFSWQEINRVLKGDEVFLSSADDDFFTIHMYEMTEFFSQFEFEVKFRPEIEDRLDEAPIDLDVTLRR